MTARVEDYLRENPMLSVIFSYATAIFALFAELTPLFACVSAILGAIVIFYTLRIKLIEYEMKKAELKKHKRDL